MKPSSKIEALVKNYILDQSQSFTWENDVIERTIWGFKAAPYKSFARAQKVVSSIVAQLHERGALSIEKVEGYADRITVSKAYLIY